MNEDTLLQKIKRKIEQLYKSGFSNPTEIAKKIHSDLSIDENTRTINHTRGNVKYYISRAKKRSENPALAQACEERGINFDNVGIAWNKDKKWSIQFRPSKTGPTFEEMLQDHIDEIKNHTFKYEKIKRADYNFPCLLVIDPADIHVGKLASSFETGEDYNTQIAVKRVNEGVNGILHKSSGFDIDKIVFVAGNDILHIDTPKRLTTSGTPQDTDGMWYDNFLVAKKLYIDILDKLIKIADVHVMYNPSNHDYTNGFFLADAIKSWYRNCSNISFDVSIAHRKYFKYGTSLIGTTHGDGAKQQDLPLLMAQESGKLWSDTKHRYVYIHHLHHKISKDYHGVTVEALRSPSSADSWHHRNGYQHSPKAIEGFVHSRSNGQIARFTHLF
tara:strand:- start:3762 stop:4922 length:1161 start_codon:yes stop_codon:yes gene_type:complete